MKGKDLSRRFQKNYQSGIFIAQRKKEEDTEDTELDVDGGAAADLYLILSFSQFLAHLGTLSFKNFINMEDNRKPPGFSLNND